MHLSCREAPLVCVVKQLGGHMSDKMLWKVIKDNDSPSCKVEMLFIWPSLIQIINAVNIGLFQSM